MHESTPITLNVTTPRAAEPAVAPQKPPRKKRSRRKPETVFEEPDLLTTEQIAQIINFSERTVFRFVTEGKIPSYKIKRSRRFNKDRVLAALGLFEQKSVGQQLPGHE